MNFLKKYAILLAILLYLIIGVSWLIYIYHADSQATFHWSWKSLLLDAFLVVIWPIYPFNLLITGIQGREGNLILIGIIGFILSMAIFFSFFGIINKAKQKN